MSRCACCARASCATPPNGGVSDVRTASAAEPSARCEPGERGIGELFMLGDVVADVAPLRRGISGVEHIRVLSRPQPIPPRRLLSLPAPAPPELVVLGIADERRAEEADVAAVTGERVGRMDTVCIGCGCCCCCC